MKPSERVLVDDALDMVVIDGFPIAMRALEDLLLTPTRPGQWFRVDKVDPATHMIELTTKHDDFILSPDAATTKETLQ